MNSFSLCLHSRRVRRCTLTVVFNVTLLLFVLYVLRKRQETIQTLPHKMKEYGIQQIDLPMNGCVGESADDRVCRVSNLCFDALAQEWFQVVSNHSMPEWTASDVGKLKGDWFADQTSVTGHPSFRWRWYRAESLHGMIIGNDTFATWTDRRLKSQIRIIQQPVHLVKRLLGRHAFHLVHDELLGVWDVRRRVKDADSRRVVFVDASSPGPYDVFTDIVTKSDWSLMWSLLDSKPEVNPDRVICFRDALIGTSKRLIWYQYGFNGPPSPLGNILDYPRDDLSAFAEHIRAGFGVSVEPNFVQKRNAFFEKFQKNRKPTIPKDMVIALIARNQTRLILNEDELAASLTQAFGLPVVRVAQEDMSPEDMIRVMSKTAIMVGLHGALQIFGLWMPVGGIMLEAIPYAIPPDLVRHYERMCRLLGHRNRHWSSPYPSPPYSIGHADRDKSKGGLDHLTPARKRAILKQRWIRPPRCCMNPAWLYRLNQDTWVDTEQVIQLIKNAMKPS